MKYKYSKQIAILIPPFLIVGIIVFSAIVFVIPTIKKKMVEQQKEWIREMVVSTNGILDSYYQLAKKGEITEEKAKELAITVIGNLRYGAGSKEYFWILDQENNLISHPYINEDLSSANIDLEIEIEKIVAFADSVHEGFVQYKWPYYYEKGKVLSKISFFSTYEPWKWIVGTGFYVQDINEKTNHKIRDVVHLIIFTGILLFVVLLIIVYGNFKHLKEIAEKEADIYINKSWLQGLSDYSGDGLLVYEHDQVVFANKNFRKIFGFNDHEAFGMALLDLIDETDKLIVVPQLIEVFKGNVSFYNARFYITTKTGERKYIWSRTVSNKNELGYLTTFVVISDLTENKKFENDLIQASQFIEQSPNSVIITDIKGDIEFVNPIFEKQTGYSLNEVRGKNPRLLKSNNMPKEFYEELWHKISTGYEWRGEILNRKKNGELFWENAVIFPLKDGNGKIIKYGSVKTDITHRKKIQEELLKAKEEAVLGEKLKSAFLANVSHEVNTPLNAILGFTQLLQCKISPNDKDYGYLKTIIENTESLMNIFTDVIYYSKMDSGIFDIKNENIDIDEFLSKVCSKHNVKIIVGVEKSLEIRLSPDNRYQNIIVNTDKNLLGQIFNKLIDNAIKYTHAGYIEIKYRLTPTDIVFYVADTGGGISESEKMMIFQLFYHGNKEYVSLHKGLGIGLSLAKKYVEVLGGVINFQSIYGQGTTFYFNLPISKVAFTQKK